MNIHTISEQIEIQASLDEVWGFISSPRNLQQITPDYMGFKIITPNLPDRMYPGMIIAYKVSPVMGIKMTWVTEITQVEEKKYFVDEQRIGPYKMWHHEHFIEATEQGVLMKDIVNYKLPLGFLGELAHYLFVRKQLKEIFQYRRNTLEEKYGVS
jgi:ligand-binding SRPBCC domain-containing protein